jgi:hypothetical protein
MASRQRALNVDKLARYHHGGDIAEPVSRPKYAVGFAYGALGAGGCVRQALGSMLIGAGGGGNGPGGYSSKYDGCTQARMRYTFGAQ